MRIFTIVIFTILLGFDSEGQTTKKSNLEATKSRQIQIFRKIFWDSLPKPYGYINDFEGLYSDEEEQVLDSIISVFQSETSIEIAILTLDTIYTSKEKFDALALRIANHWGVGEKDNNNGILIGISRGHRRIRINNGIGIEKLITDNETKVIVDNYLIPFFKNEKYFDGTLTGLIELINLLKKKIK